jgi:hypothetical protein
MSDTVALAICGAGFVFWAIAVAMTIRNDRTG